LLGLSANVRGAIHGIFARLRHSVRAGDRIAFTSPTRKARPELRIAASEVRTIFVGDAVLRTLVLLRAMSAVLDAAAIVVRRARRRARRVRAVAKISGTNGADTLTTVVEGLGGDSS
jgi:hypothetical protein